MNWWVLALRLAGLGWYVALCIVIGVVAGFWLDRIVGTIPIFTLLGVVLGSIAAFWGLYKMVYPLLYSSRHSLGTPPHNRPGSGAAAEDTHSQRQSDN